MDEMRSQMIAHWDKDALNYDEDPAHHDANDLERWRKLFDQCGKNSKLLDVGCGTGFVALVAAEYGFDATGLDWSQMMIERASKSAKTIDLSLRFVQGFTEKLPFEGNTFDIVASRHVLWTLVNPVECFQEWRRVLRQGGKVFSDYTPRKEEYGNIGKHFPMDIESQLPLNRDVGPEEIKALFREAGFSAVSHESYIRETNRDGKIRRRESFMFTCEK